MKKILILGATGMLGQTFLNLEKSDQYSFLYTTRTGKDTFGKDCIKFDCEKDCLESILSMYEPKYVINCIGLVKQKIQETSISLLQSAIFVNAFFPRSLGQLASKFDFKVIQIATDCVFDGTKGDYLETDLHTATDIYGITKSLGEVNNSNFLNLRSSIIGKATNTEHSLLNWFLKLNENSAVYGYSNHIWNGITTLAFAKICMGIIRTNSFTSGTFHIVPADKMSKYELLEEFRKKFSRLDLVIKSSDVLGQKNLSLSTKFPVINTGLWQQAGYAETPSIRHLISEMR